MDVGTLYRRTLEIWADRVADAAGCDWTAPTPCRDWTVRDLVNHVTGEDLWTAPLLRGETIERVGDRFDGDLLGSRTASAAPSTPPAEASRARRGDAAPRTERSTCPTARSRWTSTSASSLPTTSSTRWDLAVATGGDTRPRPGAGGEVASWFDGT